MNIYGREKVFFSLHSMARRSLLNERTAGITPDALSSKLQYTAAQSFKQEGYLLPHMTGNVEAGRFLGG